MGLARIGRRRCLNYFVRCGWSVQFKRTHARHARGAAFQIVPPTPRRAARSNPTVFHPVIPRSWVVNPPKSTAPSPHHNSSSSSPKPFASPPPPPPPPLLHPDEHGTTSQPGTPPRFSLSLPPRLHSSSPTPSVGAPVVPSPPGPACWFLRLCLVRTP
jgi:hypothetical protein